MLLEWAALVPKQLTMFADSKSSGSRPNRYAASHAKQWNEFTDIRVTISATAKTNRVAPFSMARRITSSMIWINRSSFGQSLRSAARAFRAH
jgi:hypothetical protein